MSFLEGGYFLYFSEFNNIVKMRAKFEIGETKRERMNKKTVTLRLVAGHDLFRENKFE